MNTFTIHFTSGNSITTSMNATLDEARAYYWPGAQLNVGRGADDLIETVKSVVQVDDAKQFAIEQLRATMLAETQRRSQNAKEHAAREAAAALLDGGRDWSAQPV